MRSITPFVLALVLCSSAFAAGTMKDDALVPIFNGKDLTGWRVPDPNPWWSATEGGVLLGHSDTTKKGNDLWTQKLYQDVLFECDFKFSGDIDSGVFLRQPNVQVQIGTSRSLKKDMTASIYHKGKYLGVAHDVDKLLKIGEWNSLKIQAIGNKFDVWLNGQHVLTYETPDSPNPAPIGLQIHPGVDMKIEYRNLKAQALNDVPAEAEAKYEASLKAKEKPKK